MSICLPDTGANASTRGYREDGGTSPFRLALAQRQSEPVLRYCRRPCLIVTKRGQVILKKCGSWRCSMECYRSWCRRWGAILAEAALQLPPDFFLTLKSGSAFGEDFVPRLQRFFEKLRYQIKKEGHGLEYCWRLEWMDYFVHAHLLLRTGAELTHALVKALWHKAWPEAAGRVYCEPVRTPVGAAKYLAKVVKDSRKCQPPPADYAGRLTDHSRAYLPAPAKRIWRDLVEGWFPAPAAGDTLSIGSKSEILVPPPDGQVGAAGSAGERQGDGIAGEGYGRTPLTGHRLAWRPTRLLRADCDDINDQHHRQGVDHERHQHRQ